jgi:hypothetical protein
MLTASRRSIWPRLPPGGVRLLLAFLELREKRLVDAQLPGNQRLRQWLVPFRHGIRPLQHFGILALSIGLEPRPP